MFLHRPITVLMAYAAVLLLGFLSLQQLAVDLFPDLNYPKLLIRTRFEEASPREVHELVTRPIEEAASAVNGVKEIASTSREGLSLVTLTFYWGTRMDYAALAVREALDEIRPFLPEQVQRPRVLPVDPAALPILQIAVQGASLNALTNICQQVIRRRLEQIKGVALVRVLGGVTDEIEVVVDLPRLMAQGFTLEDVTQTLKNNNTALTGGTIKQGRYQQAIRIDGRLRSVEDIQQLVITSAQTGQQLYLRDVALIRRIPEEPGTLIRLNSQPAIGLMVTREAGSNTVETVQKVLTVLQAIQNQYPRLRFHIITNQATFIEQSIQNVFSALIWGGILAFVVLFLFLQNFWHPFTIGISIPVSVIATFVVMHLTGVSVNMMSLGGLALGIGMLVDNSIVVLENIFRHREEGQELVSAARNGAREVALPILASTLTTCAVFLPIIYVRGIAGQLFRDQSLTVTFALLTSWVVSLTLLPVLASQLKGRRLYTIAGNPRKRAAQASRWLAGFLRGTKILQRFLKGVLQWMRALLWLPLQTTFDRFFNRIVVLYHSGLIHALNLKKQVLIGIILLAGFTLLLGAKMDRELFPPIQGNSVQFQLELPQGATLTRTAEITGEIEQQFLRLPEVQNVYSIIGEPPLLVQPSGKTGSHRAMIILQLKPPYRATDAFIQRLREVLPRQYEYHGVFVEGESIYRQVLGLAVSSFEIDVKGTHLEQILPVARKVKDWLEYTNGFADVQWSHQSGGSQWVIQLDREQLNRLGISSESVISAIQQKLGGVSATSIREFDRTIDIVVKTRFHQRVRWEDVANMFLNNKGKFIPLNALIHTRQMPAVAHLDRLDQEAVIRITAALSGISHQQAREQWQRWLQKHPIPSNVRVELGGNYREMRRSIRSIIQALVISIILVYMILAAQFESLLHPFIILLTVPLGIMGGVWMLALWGQTWNVISGIGFIVLAGIVVNDGILKVDFINRSRLQGLSVREAILAASRKRFRPIVITTVTTVLGLIPMAFSGGSGSELRQPLAIVVMGGLLVATFFTLIFIPVVYEWFARGD